jgi:polyphenol oxidase
VLVASDLLARGVVAAFTGRAGGRSQPPFDTCNLGLRVGDELRTALANRRRVATVLGVAGLPWATVRQVHGRTVAQVSRAGMPGGPPEARPPLAEADALVTGDEGVVLVVLVADCVPVLLSGGGVIAAVHSGRPGLVAGVVPRTLAVMRELGAHEVDAVVGPSVCGRCYEVPGELQDVVAAVEPVSRATTSWGTPSLDVAAGVRAQLERDEVEVVDLSRCTVESPDLFSYRRDGPRSGRQAGMIRITA